MPKHPEVSYVCKAILKSPPSTAGLQKVQEPFLMLELPILDDQGMGPYAAACTGIAYKFQLSVI